LNMHFISCAIQHSVWSENALKYSNVGTPMALETSSSHVLPTKLFCRYASHTHSKSCQLWNSSASVCQKED
jgi:hypothetical protein